ncbi:MAG: HD domain-containing protein, partial [Promethearchaeota archaeon]
MKDFTKYRKALNFTIFHYKNLERKYVKIPAFIHPIRIASILRAVGYNEFDHEDIMIAALFHDLIEDTDVTSNDIKEQFGSKIANIVIELSKPKEKDKEEWLKNFKNLSNEARIIKLADRIDNLMDMEMWPTT